MFKKLGKKAKALGVIGASTVMATASQAALEAPDMTEAMTDVGVVFAATLGVSALVFGFKQIRRVL